MSPGLGFLKGVVIDQHFAERGRMGRLLAAVALNPASLGIGIDEDTAILVEGDEGFSVLGAGAVDVIDGTEMTHTNAAQRKREGTLPVGNVRRHSLSNGYRFNLHDRKPIQRVKSDTATNGSADDVSHWARRLLPRNGLTARRQE